MNETGIIKVEARNRKKNMAEDSLNPTRETKYRASMNKEAIPKIDSKFDARLDIRFFKNGNIRNRISFMIFTHRACLRKLQGAAVK